MKIYIIIDTEFVVQVGNIVSVHHTIEIRKNLTKVMELPCIQNKPKITYKKVYNTFQKSERFRHENIEIYVKQL